MSNTPWTPQQPFAIPPTIYANSAQVIFSPFDLMIEFSQLAVVQTAVQQQEGNEADVQAQVISAAAQRVFMSPQHAKAFHRVLGQNIERYEAQFGTVPDIDLSQT